MTKRPEMKHAVSFVIASIAILTQAAAATAPSDSDAKRFLAGPGESDQRGWGFIGMLKCLGVVLCVVCFQSGSMVGREAFAAETGDVQEAVKTAIISHYGKIRSLVFSEELTATSTEPDSIEVHGQISVKVEFRPDKPGHISRVYHDVYKDEPEFVIDMKSGEVTARECNERWATAYDGETTQVLRAYMDGTEYRRGQVQGYIKSAPPHIPNAWAWALLPAGPSYLSSVLEDASVSGPLEWEGRQVYAIEGHYGNPINPDRSHNLTFYVDPERDYAFCYAEWRRKNGEVITRTTIKAFKEVDGIWLPSHYEYLAYFATKVVKSMGSIEYKSVNVEMASSDFRFEWPRGTLVHDEIAGVEYYVESSVPDNMTLLTDETRLDGLLEELNTIQKVEERVGDPTEAQGNSGPGGGIPPSTTSSLGWWIAMGVIASFMGGVAIVGIVHRLRARKETPEE